MRIWFVPMNHNNFERTNKNCRGTHLYVYNIFWPLQLVCAFIRTKVTKICSTSNKTVCKMRLSITAMCFIYTKLWLFLQYFLYFGNKCEFTIKPLAWILAQIYYRSLCVCWWKQRLWYRYWRVWLKIHVFVFVFYVYMMLSLNENL